MHKRYIVLIGLFVALSARPASATQINSVADAALAGSTLIDFESAPLGIYSSLTLSTVTFSAAPGGSVLTIADASDGGTYGGVGHELSTRQSLYGFDISFNSPVSAFGMNWGGANENWTVRVFNSGSTLIETLTFLGGDPGKGATYIEYYGAKASDIKRVELLADAADWVKIDSFRFAPESAIPTPEPATLFLCTTGIALLGGAARWRGRDQ